jgi:aryl-alcohol dehydrogenase-like predicted oxidoreductase
VALGQVPQGPGSRRTGLRRAADALRPGLDSTHPANAVKLDAADALGALADEAGLTLVQLAIAFVTRHPAVTSRSWVPRTMEHLESYLTADGVDLPGDLLDRIDDIVAPGHTVNVADNMWSSSTSALGAASRRR